MDIFNAPSRETCTVRRERTNTPLQALVTLNDPQFVEAARNLAQRALKEGGDDAGDRIDFIAQRLLARPFRAEEHAGRPARRSTKLRGVLPVARPTTPTQAARASASRRPIRRSTPATLAAWTMLANELMNLDEVSEQVSLADGHRSACR